MSSTFAISSWGNGVVAITAGLLAQVASGRLIIMISFTTVDCDDKDALFVLDMTPSVNVKYDICVGSMISLVFQFHPSPPLSSLHLFAFIEQNSTNLALNNL